MAGEERHRYSVAWLDLLADGPKMGRAVVSRADPTARRRALPGAADAGSRRRVHAAVGHIATRSRGKPHSRFRRGLPRGPAAPVVRAHVQRAALACHSAARARAPAGAGAVLLSAGRLGEWNRLYGPAGLIQYQFVFPCGQEAALVRCFELMRTRRLPVYLAVFKRFGASFGGPLSFPLEGWTLAVDLPAGAPGLRAALDELDEVVAGCGGRVYLTKDARLRRETLGAMYPELDRFCAQRARVDPERGAALGPRAAAGIVRAAR